MSYDMWMRVDRVACRVTGHSWVGQDGFWLAEDPLRACVRCGATDPARPRGRHRIG